MDLLSTLSLILYLGTFLIGFYLDRDPLNLKYKRVRKWFSVWLYVFLCFGYMTGSDWRGYELEYGLPPSSIISFTEEGFYKMFYYESFIFKDFWLGVGVLKCMYLYTYIRLLKQLTSNYLSVVTLSMPVFLCFMLIDNPLRFMCAVILVHVAMLFIISKKYLVSVVIIIIASLFHTTALFFLLMIPCYIIAKKVANVNPYLLTIIFILTLYVTSNVGNIVNIVAFVMQYAGMLDMKDYSRYMLKNEDGGSFFTIGSLIQIFYFIFIVSTKDSLKKNVENGGIISGMAVLYMFLQRFTLMIPTGFRLAIPFGIFYCLYIVMLKKNNKKVFFIFITIITLQFSRKLYTSYNFIPYSNSIPYIITGHKDYFYRDSYNFNAYRNRIGHDVPTEE